MIYHMKGMTYWNTDVSMPCRWMTVYEVEVKEFDFRDDNGICNDKDGVIIRH